MYVRLDAYVCLCEDEKTKRNNSPSPPSPEPDPEPCRIRINTEGRWTRNKSAEKEAIVGLLRSTLKHEH